MSQTDIMEWFKELYTNGVRRYFEGYEIKEGLQSFYKKSPPSNLSTQLSKLAKYRYLEVRYDHHEKPSYRIHKDVYDRLCQSENSQLSADSQNSSMGRNSLLYEES